MVSSCIVRWVISILPIYKNNIRYFYTPIICIFCIYFTSVYSVQTYRSDLWFVFAPKIIIEINYDGPSSTTMQ